MRFTPKHIGAAGVALIAPLLFAPGASASPVSPQLAAEHTFYPPQRWWPEADVINDLRGQYIWDPRSRWVGDSVAQELFPRNTSNNSTRPSWPGTKTYYTRVTWADIEKSSGSASAGFDYSILESRIAAAAARGQRTIFRIMPLDNTSDAAQVRSFPGYLSFPYDGTGRMREWKYESGGIVRYVPDWNDSDYVDAVARMIADVGRKYDADPRVVGFDISGYGAWGEWNSEISKDIKGGPGPLTVENAQRIINANVAAFPRTQLFALTNSPYLGIAMSASSKIGIRVDCLGSSDGGGAWQYMSYVPEALDRWRTAPVATEFCSNYGSADAATNSPMAEEFFRAAADQVRKYHVSLISSGNLRAQWHDESLSDAEWEYFSAAAKSAGYRYSVNSATLPERVRRGERLAVKTQWINSGSAPVYDRPSVYLELRSAGSSTNMAVVQSAIDLTGLVSDAAADPGMEKHFEATVPQAKEVHPEYAYQTVSDSIQVPAGVAPGVYDLAVIAWPSYRKSASGVPGLGSGMRLAQEDETPDGHYRIGQVVVE